MVRLGRRNGSFPISAAQGAPPLRGILAWMLHLRRAATSHTDDREREVLAADRSTVRTGVDDDVEERSSVDMTLLSGLDIAWIDQE